MTRILDYTGNSQERSTTVAEIMERKVATVGMHASSSELPRIFDRGEVALVVDEQRQVQALVTKLDLIDLLASRRPASAPTPTQ